MNNNNNEDKGLLKIDEVAQILNVKTSWIRSAVFKKEIPYIKVGNLLRFKKEELNEWMRQKTITPR